ncbi:MAG TPA: phospholipid carrier-dependent glycosyltransferase [Vicinamibacterales bacterium]|nr:phospholipid carrier-dependent glycosyltransferase [Vicinamibacterales bacterium]
MTAAADVGRRSALVWVLLATALGAAFRFYGLGWGAPYFHFHIDEHIVFTYADALARDSKEAANSAKFFMYSPFPMYVLNGVVAIYSALSHPLDLTLPRDEVTYMLLGRAISASLGAATVPLTYMTTRLMAGRRAGILAAFLIAAAVIHLRESHFFSLDVSMTFFTMLGFYSAMRIVTRGDVASEAGAAVALGLGVASKYSAAFLAPLIGIAELLSPRAPAALRPFDAGRWLRVVLRAVATIAAGVAIFLLLDWLVIRYFDKFRDDITVWVIDPLSGATKPEWIAQFADVNALPYWFTNLLVWSLGPALEIAGLAGVVWLLAVRRDRPSMLAAAFPILYFLSAGKTATVAPFIRYAVPLAPPLALAAGVLCADLIARPRWRTVGIVTTAIVIGSTLLWAVAYMNVFRQPDSRLEASRWLLQNVPAGAKVLIEPSHNTPPTGSYLTNVNFHGNYVLFYPQTEKKDYYQLFALDTYRSLYNRGVDDDFRRNYIQSRLALADWIVMDDTFLQQYQHLPEPDHAVVKQYYRDLFAGKLGFKLVKTFKVFPSLFGLDINDDAAELTFRSFDHPRVFIFMRQ